MKKILLLMATLSAIVNVAAQGPPLDSAKQLHEVLIQAYSSNRTLDRVAASIGYVSTRDLNRFSNTSLVPAVNTIAGVRMEERSPGSYRFSIRGSLLRSPFGVRNVKVYWNGLPLTDGGGNTYLNLLDFSSVGSIEVIKGPGGSLYGAGTGGVVLLSSPDVTTDQLSLSTTVGSYGLERFAVAGRIHSSNVVGRIQFAHQSADGYREHSKMTRDAINADVTFLLSDASTLSATLFYTDLFYQTPGGLTAEEFREDPRRARPASGVFPGAVDQHAAVANQSPYVGFVYEHEWNSQWMTRIGAFASLSDFSNPTIRNYELRKERNAGGRTETQFVFGSSKESKITFGAEYQSFNSDVNVFGNNLGLIDTVQTRDELNSKLMMFFGQAEYDLPQNFFLTIGGSVNLARFGFARSYPVSIDESRDLELTFSPRIALLNKINPGMTAFISMSRGFSPPSLAELYPSRQIFDRKIQSESGINLEAGVRGKDLKDLFSFDFTVYQFKLKEALVIRRDASIPGGPEYFVNAGETLQRGVEALVSLDVIKSARTLISDLRIWNSFAYQHYRFEDYVQNEDDFSGNKLTGVPPVTNASGLDVTLAEMLYLNITSQYVDHSPLNDANTEFANEYLLLGGRIGFKRMFNGNLLDAFAGIDNALDRTHSLGNDLNAVGGRFFNAAPGVSYYAGLRFTIVR